MCLSQPIRPFLASAFLNQNPSITCKCFFQPIQAFVVRAFLFPCQPDGVPHAMPSRARSAPGRTKPRPSWGQGPGVRARGSGPGGQGQPPSAHVDPRRDGSHLTDPSGGEDVFKTQVVSAGHLPPRSPVSASGLVARWLPLGVREPYPPVEGASGLVWGLGGY